MVGRHDLDGGRASAPARARSMRRGTLIGPSVEQMLATFADCGQHDMVILRVLSAVSWRPNSGRWRRAALPAQVRRYAGDMATIGKGELLLTA